MMKGIPLASGVVVTQRQSLWKSQRPYHPPAISNGYQGGDLACGGAMSSTALGG